MTDNLGSSTPTIEDVRGFWNNNPLWVGESRFPPGSKEFFEEQLAIVINDNLGGSMDERIFPRSENNENVLDLGCGPGLWTIELAKRGAKKITSADLTQSAIDLARQRCEIYSVKSQFRIENAENLSFEDGIFSHVNCQGVIHHTPNTEACISEIARVLREGGTATVSVYYRNIFLRLWPLFRFAGKIIYSFGGKLQGRGRENIFALDNPDEIVRLYDGKENPIGKSYSREIFSKMLSPYFIIEDMYLHFFPARTLPFKIPRWLHKLLDSNFGFMIYVNLRKR